MTDANEPANDYVANPLTQDSAAPFSQNLTPPIGANDSGALNSRQLAAEAGSFAQPSQPASYPGTPFSDPADEQRGSSFPAAPVPAAQAAAPASADIPPVLPPLGQDEERRGSAIPQPSLPTTDRVPLAEAPASAFPEDPRRGSVVAGPAASAADPHQPASYSDSPDERRGSAIPQPEHTSPLSIVSPPSSAPSGLDDSRRGSAIPNLNPVSHSPAALSDPADENHGFGVASAPPAAHPVPAPLASAAAEDPRRGSQSPEISTPPSGAVLLDRPSGQLPTAGSHLNFGVADNPTLRRPGTQL